MQTPSVRKMLRLLELSHICFFSSFVSLIIYFLSLFKWGKACHTDFGQGDHNINSGFHLQALALNCWHQALHCALPTAPLIRRSCGPHSPLDHSVYQPVPLMLSKTRAPFDWCVLRMCHKNNYFVFGFWFSPKYFKVNLLFQYSTIVYPSLILSLKTMNIGTKWLWCSL